MVNECSETGTLVFGAKLQEENDFKDGSVISII